MKFFFFACESEGNEAEDVSVPLWFLDTSFSPFNLLLTFFFSMKRNLYNLLFLFLIVLSITTAVISVCLSIPSSSFNLDKMFLLSHRNRKYNENCVVLFYADEMGKR